MNGEISGSSQAGFVHCLKQYVFSAVLHGMVAAMPAPPVNTPVPYAPMAQITLLATMQAK